MTRRLTQREMRIVLAIEEDVNDRRGLKTRSLDVAIRREIRQAWKAAVVEAEPAWRALARHPLVRCDTCGAVGLGIAQPGEWCWGGGRDLGMVVGSTGSVSVTACGVFRARDR